MRKRTVLLVSDDEELGRSVTEGLSPRDFLVETVGSGDRLKIITRQATASYLVLDAASTALNLPVFLLQVRTLLADRPVLVLRPSAQVAELAESLGYGAGILDENMLAPEVLAGALDRAHPPEGIADLSPQSEAADAEEAADEATEGDSETPESGAASETRPADEGGTDPDQSAKAASALLIRRRPVIALAGLKGGCGKSTIAMHLITSLLYEGLEVASLDLDHAQRSLSRYIKNREIMRLGQDREVKMPYVIETYPEQRRTERLEDVINRAAKASDCVVIDCPGAHSPDVGTALACADIVITPINDSFIDLDVLATLDPKTGQMIESGAFSKMILQARSDRRQRYGRDLDWIVIRNRLGQLDSRNGRAMAERLAELAQNLAFREASGLSERVIYRELFLQGLTLVDLCASGSDVQLSMSHVAARQELRGLLGDITPRLLQAA